MEKEPKKKSIWGYVIDALSVSLPGGILICGLTFLTVGLQKKQTTYMIVGAVLLGIIVVATVSIIVLLCWAFSAKNRKPKKVESPTEFPANENKEH